MPATNDISILRFNATGAKWEHTEFTPAYGAIRAFENASTTAMGGSGAYGQILEFTSDGLSLNTTPSYADGHIQVLAAGVYLISYHVSVTCTVASKTLDLQVKLNNGATAVTSLTQRRDISSADYGTVSGADYVTLAANDTVELWAALVEAGATSITMRNGNLRVRKMLT